jgi:hypothetical protein
VLDAVGEEPAECAGINRRGVVNEKSYRYYVSQALLQQRNEDAGSLPRLPAHDFESLISGRIVEVLGADARMKEALVKLGWNNDEDRQRLLRIIIKRIEVWVKSMTLYPLSTCLACCLAIAISARRT